MDNEHIVVTYSEAKDIIQNNLSTMSESFIAIGYYLKHIRDNELFRQDRFDSIWEFAWQQYGIKRTTASRWMEMNSRFSKDGNTPILAEEYKIFGKSQLQEMLYLDDKQIEEVTPEMTVKEIREIRKGEEPSEEIPGQMEINDFPEVLPKEESPERKSKFSEWIEGNDQEDGQTEMCDVAQNKENGFTQQELQELEEEGGCQPNNTGCIRQEWGTSREEQEQGRKECKKCWDTYRSRMKVLSESESEEITRTEDGPKKCITGKNRSGYCGYAAYCIEPYNCCSECGAKCNARCGWLEEKEEIVPQEECAASHMEEEQAAVADQENVIDAEYEVIEQNSDERYEETTDKTDISILNDMIYRENKMLNDMLKCYTDNDFRVRKQKLLVGALEGMMCELENTEDVVESENEQPELPILKNNEMRKDFLNEYNHWQVWFEVPEADETYYRYNLPDGSSIVICEYKTYCEWKERYSDEDPETLYTREYLLKSGYKHLNDCKVSRSVLVEHLKEVQKK